MAGRDRHRHSLTFSTGQNKNSYSDNYFSSGNGKFFAMTGWNYGYYFNFNLGIQTGFGVSVTRTGFGISPSLVPPEPHSYPSFQLTNSSVVPANQNTYNEAYTFKNQMLSPQIESQYSIEIPLRMLYSSDFYGPFRFNVKGGLISKLNFLNRVGNKSTQILGGLVYREYLRPNNKKFFCQYAQFSVGVEWNYVGTRTISLDIDYRTNLTKIYKTNIASTYIFEMVYAIPGEMPIINFISPVARKHQFSVTLSITF